MTINKPQNMKTLIITLLFTTLAGTLPAAEGTQTTPSPSVAKDSRCFELRTYYAAPGKLEALNARFRDHTCRLFKKHGMEIVGFWMPTDKEQGAENKLVYMLAHKSREAAKKSWADFQNDPDWKKARSESEANGKLVEKVESVFMAATDYSTIK
jgi:hypothetical protein